MFRRKLLWLSTGFCVLSLLRPFALSSSPSPLHVVCRLLLSNIPTLINPIRSICPDCRQSVTGAAYHRRICTQNTVKCAYPDLTSAALGPVIEFECRRNPTDRLFWCVRCHRMISRDTDKMRVSCFFEKIFFRFGILSNPRLGPRKKMWLGRWDGPATPTTGNYVLYPIRSPLIPFQLQKGTPPWPSFPPPDAPVLFDDSISPSALVDDPASQTYVVSPTDLLTDSVSMDSSPPVHFSPTLLAVDDMALLPDRTPPTVLFNSVLTSAPTSPEPLVSPFSSDPFADTPSETITSADLPVRLDTDRIYTSTDVLSLGLFFTSTTFSNTVSCQITVPIDTKPHFFARPAA
jgi:hypothetical protein